MTNILFLWEMQAGGLPEVASFIMHWGFSFPIEIELWFFHPAGLLAECLHTRFVTWDLSFMRFHENMVDTF